MTTPGYKTSEFWLTLAGEIVSCLVVSGVFQSNESMKVLAMCGAIISRVSYVFARYKAKVDANG